MVGGHIRIHKLRKEDNLLQCVKGYQDDKARAVIVINYTNESTLPQDILQSLVNGIGNFLVGVVPLSVGNELLDCLQEMFQDDELYAR